MYVRSTHTRAPTEIKQNPQNSNQILVKTMSRSINQENHLPGLVLYKDAKMYQLWMHP